MLKKWIATAAVSTNLVLTTCAPGAFAASGFKSETAQTAVAKPMTGAVSVTSQTAIPQLHGSLSQFEKFGLFCESNGKNDLPAIVTGVGANSPAFLKGLQAGDGIVALKSSANTYLLTIDRDGKMYAISLSASDLAPNPNLSARSGVVAAAIQSSSFNAKARKSDVVMPVSQPIATRVEEHPFAREIAADRHSGVIQGATGNCWFEASLSAVADSPQGPALLSSMIGNSMEAYTVKFPNFQTVTITNSQLAQSNLHDPSKWAALFELAEMQVYPDNAPSRGAMVGNPGVKVGLELLTGRNVSFVRPEELSTGELSNLLDRLHSQGQPVTMASTSPQEHRQRVQPVVPNHAYSLVDFDKSNGLVTLRNPLGNPGPGGNGMVRLVSNDEIQIDLPTFSTFFRFVAYPN